jgi:hypothetical protein
MGAMQTSFSFRNAPSPHNPPYGGVFFFKKKRLTSFLVMLEIYPEMLKYITVVQRVQENITCRSHLL